MGVAAAHSVAIGTWRLSLRCTKLRRDRRYADIDRPPASIASEAYDPFRSSAGPKSCTATNP
jgi:hypothetical protein